MPNSIAVIYLLLSIIVSTAIGIYAWRNRQTGGSKAFAVACAATIVWTIGDLISRLSGSFNEQWAGEIVRYLGIVTLPVALWVFIHQYCGKEISRRAIRWLSVIPIISWLVIITNSFHHLFFSRLITTENSPLRGEFGFYFWAVHLPYSYFLLFVGILKALFELRRASRDYRRQILFLVAAISIPFIFNLIGVVKAIPNLTPLGFPLFCIILGYGIFRYQFLGSNPIAYETVFKTIRDGVLILDRHDIIRDINPAAAKGLEKDPSEVIGTHVREAFKAWQTAIKLYDERPLELGEIEVSLFGETRFLSIDSTPLAGHNGNAGGRIITIRDITDRRNQQLSLETLAFHDPLTRLANRRKFEEEFEIAVEKAITAKQPLAILYFDLNRFKEVNDTFGHQAGDELLKYVAARAASILRKPDILARLGGDEFAVLLSNCSKNGVELVVERILNQTQRPFRLGENVLLAELSIGAAFYPTDGKSLTELLRQADLRMYRAKQNGGGYLPNLTVDLSAGLEM